MRILYAETTAYYPSSAHFLEALEHLHARGLCEYRFLDEAKFINPARSLAERIGARIVGRAMRGYRELNHALVEQADAFRPDLVLIGKGGHFAAETLRAVKRSCGATLVNWATDDPFNPADNSRDLLESIPLYDLYVCTKRAVMPDVVRAGCANVIYVRFGYKPAVHFPETAANEDERRRFACDVMFAGSADSDRVPYFETLVQEIPDLRLHLYGGFWNRSPSLKPYARGVVTGRDYRLAISGAKICVNLVRRANRDDHVMRTFEIPACAGFMLTEQTSAHAELFGSQHTAIFFSSPDELVAKVKFFLDRDADRSSIAASMHRLICGHANTYADRLDQILDAARPLMNSRAPNSDARPSRSEFEPNG